AAHSRGSLPRAGERDWLVVGRHGRPREDHADLSLRRRAPGNPGTVEHNGELVARLAVSSRQVVNQRPPAGLEALALAHSTLGGTPDNVVAIDEPAHCLAVFYPSTIGSGP